MTSFLQFLLLLSILLLTAKLAGYAAMRLGQPSVLGELLVGVLLGPSALNLFHWPVFTAAEELQQMVSELGEIGVLLLMFVAGLELHLSELRSNFRVSIWAGTLGVLGPVLMGLLIGAVFGMETAPAIFLGLVMAATSVSISAQTLIEMKMLKSRLGLGLLGAAVLDDVLVILFLSVFFAFNSGAASWVQIVLVGLRMFLFFGLSFAFGFWVLPWLVSLTKRLAISQGTLTLALLVLFAYALAAELLGQMAAITGAFLAGLMFARTPAKEILDSRISALAYGFFVPLFFVGIGLKTAFSFHAETFSLTLVVVLGALVSKALGAALGAKAAGFSWAEGTQLGAGMISRGEVGLIVASAGERAGLVTETEFAAVVAMVLVSTLVTPPLLRLSLQLPATFLTPKEKK